MVRRRWWEERIERAWRRRSVVWLAGVRRVGKTLLGQSLAESDYFDCELPRTRRLLEDPESFLARHRGRRLVLDEVHRLADPAQFLKIAADHYPTTKILATGSSTLGASALFRDTLTGRKEELWLTPMMSADLAAFKQPDLAHRFLHGGLPPFFLADRPPEREFQEWMDSYWAKDVQVLFRLERRHSFERFAELLMAQSGGIFEATRFATLCEASRQTIVNYLKVLEATLIVHVLRPFSTRRSTEIVSAPKVYAFDTGFVCHHRGWSSLRPEDFGLLWEHFVLNELQAHLQTRRIGYWRDKRGHEVDFVLPRRGRPPLAVECKWASGDADLAGLQAFAVRYPEADLYVVTNDAERPRTVKAGAARATELNLGSLLKRVLAEQTDGRG